jgi:hypothetical protein
MKKLILITCLTLASFNANAIGLRDQNIKLTKKLFADCKNWENLENMPYQESIKCFKAYLKRNANFSENNDNNIQLIYSIKLIDNLVTLD